MKKSIDAELTREMIVGGFSFAAIAALFYFTILLSHDSFFSSKQSVEVLFDNVMGLGKGDAVVVRGTTVGEVKELELMGQGGSVKVVCQLQQTILLKTDCRARIRQTDILGGRHLLIEEGSTSAPLRLEGTPIQGETPFDIMVETGDMVQEMKHALAQQGVLDDLRDTLEQTKEFSVKINRGEGAIAQMVNDKELYGELKAIAANLRGVSEKLNNADGSFAKLMTDETMYEDVKETVANLKDISERLADGEGMLGKMLAEDDALYEQTRLLFQDVRAAVDDFRETAPVLTFTSVFFGVF